MGPGLPNRMALVSNQHLLSCTVPHSPRRHVPIWCAEKSGICRGTGPVRATSAKNSSKAAAWPAGTAAAGPETPPLPRSPACAAPPAALPAPAAGPPAPASVPWKVNRPAGELSSVMTVVAPAAAKQRSPRSMP